MADTAEARREARRRKITENAEARMNRLLGKQAVKEPPEPSEASPVRAKKSPSPVRADKSPLPVRADKSPLPVRADKSLSPLKSEKSPSPVRANKSPVLVRKDVHASGENKTAGPYISSSPYNLRQRPQRSPVSREFEASSSAGSSGFTDEVPDGQARSSFTSRTVETRASASHSGVITSENVSDTSDGNSLLSGQRNVKTTKMIHSLLCVIMALIARLWLTHGTQFWLSQNIVIPFIVLEVTFAYLSRTYFKHLLNTHSTGNMMSAALVLCGIKPELIDIYNTTISQIFTSKTNFCIYLFCFFCWDAVLG